jgi:hypothetical protein
MKLSEQYINKIKILAGIPLNESKKEVKWEYQLRDVGGPVFYKRKEGGDWQFISAEEFAEGCSGGGKLIKWNGKS